MRNQHQTGLEMSHLSSHAASQGLSPGRSWEAKPQDNDLAPARDPISISPFPRRRKRKKRTRRNSSPKFVKRFVRRIMANRMKDKVVKDAKCGRSYNVKSNNIFKIRLHTRGTCNMIFRASAKAAFKLSCLAVTVDSCDSSQLHLSFGNSTTVRICGGTATVKERKLTELLLTHRPVLGSADSSAEPSVVKCNVIGTGGEGHRPQGKQKCPMLCGKTKVDADSIPSLYVNVQTAIDLVQKITEVTTEETTEYFTEAATEITTDASFENDTRAALDPDSSSVWKVEGGTNADKGEWPWMVYLQLLIKGSLLFCGGTIVSPRFILTAAHCVFDVEIEKGDKVVVKANEYDVKNKDETVKQSIRVQKIILHPKYRPSTQRADIALLMLRKDLVLGPGVAPICLPPEGDYEDLNTIVLGWGSLSFTGKDPRKLQKGTLMVTSLKECKKNYTSLESKYIITKKHVCTAAPGVDSCLGDSGGPVVMQLGTLWYQLGIVSFGERCAVPGYPGVNTNVVEYTSWILRQIRKDNCK